MLPRRAPSPPRAQLDKRGGALDEKIKKLDEELLRHKELIDRARPGPAKARCAGVASLVGAAPDPAQDAAKQRALRVLKQKKLYEGQRDQLYSQQFNLDQTSFAVASMEDTKLQVKAMTLAAKDLKQQFKSKELNINSIDKLTDEMADLMGMSNEIQDALGQNYSVPDDINEDELMGELDSLEFEMAAEKAAEPNATPSYLLEDLPEAPVGAAEAEAKKEELPAVRM